LGISHDVFFILVVETQNIINKERCFGVGMKDVLFESLQNLLASFDNFFPLLIS
jgi:hypothetical protein